MTPPTPTHTHIWDGGDLPDWLQLDDYHFDYGQLVIYTPDGDTRPHAGWWLIAWSDGTITAASPTSGERVYGDDGITEQLARAQVELAGVRTLRDRWVEAGPPPLGQQISRWWDKRLVELHAALDARPADDTPPATPRFETGPPPGISVDEARQMRDDLLAALAEPGPAATQATEPGRWLLAGSRDLSIPDPEPSDPTQCSGEEGFCPEHGFHRHSLKQPGARPEPEDLTGAYMPDPPIGCLTPDGEAHLAQTGIDTPGCDCGHDGRSVSWHGDDCPWRRSVVDCPGRPTPG